MADPALPLQRAGLAAFGEYTAALGADGDGGGITRGLRADLCGCVWLGATLTVHHGCDRLRDPSQGHDGINGDMSNRAERHPRIQRLFGILYEGHPTMRLDDGQ